VFNWLWEGRISVYIALAAVAVVLLIIWWRTRDRRWLIATGIVVALALVYWLLDRLVVTEAKTDQVQIKRRLEEMAAGASKGDSKPIELYLSDNFRSPRGDDKNAILQTANRYKQGVSVKLSNIEFVSPPSRAEKTVKVNFLADVEEERVRVDSVFEWDAEHGWRLRELKTFKGPVEVFPF
jgi:hypothetical protein